MATLSSELVVRLLDRVSGPAKQAGASLDKLSRQARSAARSSRSMATGPTMAGTAIARLGGLAAAYVGVNTAIDAYTKFADYDRALTRIGVTADATGGQITDAGKAIKSIAFETGLAQGAVLSGLESLVASGRTMPEALNFLPAVSRTAQAAGADVSDIAKTADALGTSMGITGGKMQRAFDLLVAGGKAGKFELKDMAQELPALAPAAAAVGMKGEDGLRRLVAMLQIVRNQTASGAEAANRMQNVFQKMESEETAKKFTKFGVNLRKEMKKARDDGRDLTETFLDLTEKATGGDLSKLNRIFTDLQVSQGVRALLTQRDALRKMNAELQNVDGSVMRDLSKVSKDAASSVQRLGNAWDNTRTSLGRAADVGGVTLRSTASPRPPAPPRRTSTVLGQGKQQGLLARREGLLLRE